MTEEQVEKVFAEVHKIANAARFKLREDIVAYAETVESEDFSEFEKIYATICGAGTATVEVLKAAIDVHKDGDRPDLFETLLKQMADVWGQTHGFPAQQRGSVQQ